MNNYPPGAANDPKAPYNEPLYSKYQVEISAEIGMFVEVECEDCHDYPCSDELKDQILDQLKDILPTLIFHTFKYTTRPGKSTVIISSFPLSSYTGRIGKSSTLASE